MARFKMAAILFIFFGFLATNTYFRWLDAAGINSRASNVLQSIIDTIMASWMGDTITSIILGLFAIIFPFKLINPKHEAQSQINLNSTSSALQGKIYKPSEAELAATKQPTFGKR